MRDNPNAEVLFYGTSHFAFETHYRELLEPFVIFWDVSSRATLQLYKLCIG